MSTREKNRVIFAHEVGDEQEVVILLRGELGLAALESIERFCHRHRVRLCQQMQEELKRPSPVTVIPESQ